MRTHLFNETLILMINGEHSNFVKLDCLTMQLGTLTLLTLVLGNPIMEPTPQISLLMTLIFETYFASFSQANRVTTPSDFTAGKRRNVGTTWNRNPC
jgi:hypothetical protein